MEDTSIIVGIDLGTTYSAIAYLDEYGKASIIPNTDNERITPSVVLFHENETIVGKIAQEEASSDPENVVQYIKRDMGNTEWERTIFQKKYTPETISACIIQHLVQDAKQYLQKDIHKAVLTVPAYFGERERKATQTAGELAGLTILGIINEPTAAAIAYGLNQNNQDHKVLVYDLGGGTFDITILHIQENKIQVIATDGEIQLGGKDWDDEIINYIAEQFIAQYNIDPRDTLETYQTLRKTAENAKITLSKLPQTRILCQCQGQTLKTQITRLEFEQKTKSLLTQTQTYIELLLQKANLQKQDIDTILLVGGSTRMPQVKQMLTEYFQKELNDTIHPDECVAIGAALYSTILDLQSSTPTQNTHFLPIDLQEKLTGLQIINVTAHSLGVIATKDGKKQNCVLIPAQSPIPIEKTELFGTEIDGQTEVNIEIVEGDSPNPEECTPIGTCKIDNLPNRKANAPIQVTFSYNENGRIQIQAIDKLTGKKAHTEIQIS
ncbi:MAG TPA: Hsp70 family protein [Planctomycetota bacterium]|nr:Hsp70 family protein [Planctomycetota bacterium]